MVYNCLSIFKATQCLVVELQYCKIWQVQATYYFAGLRHWIPRSTNCHTIAMIEKVNYNQTKPRICIFNDSNNSGGESLTNKEQVSFPNRLESTLHCEFAKHTSMHECLDGC